MLQLMILITFFPFIIALHGTGAAQAEEAPTPPCPRECTCEMAPLRSAPFVLTWMTSWGEDDLPDFHSNEVLDGGMMMSSLTASDADVDVDSFGLHATCSLHSTTNITILLSSLPSSTMVLTILQAPGCNFTVIDGGQLAGLSSVKALHLQGYAHKKEKQVSGFKPSSTHELTAHKKVVKQEVEKSRNGEWNDLRLALAEDALQPLTALELLDLQFVRLVASKEARRSRRYSKEPIASTTLLDMPLKQFLEFANRVDSFYLPPHLHPPSAPERNSKEIVGHDGDLRGNLIGVSGESYKLQRKTFRTKDEEGKISSNYGIKFHVNEAKILPDSLTEENIMPYSIYRVKVHPQLAPFKNQRKLKYLRVAHARLDRVGSELLDGLQQLHTLTLEYNKIKIVPAGLFVPTPNLRHLSLAHNNVLLLERDSLEGLSKLLTVDLDHNELSILGPGTFPALVSLKTLKINHNPLTHLLPDTFAALNATEHISLGSYDIPMDVHENSFRFLYYLRDLTLNNVTTKGLKTALLFGMPSIQHLTIHGKLEEIDYDAFSVTPNLQSLNLSHCHLNYLSLDAFYGLKQLRKLDLSHNELLAISPGTFDHLTSLRELYINNNLLTTLPLGIFIPIPAKLIQLHNNPWICTCDLLQLRPAVTNKVKRPGYVNCQWHDKVETVCKKSKDRLVYDARVAPLCKEPAELAGNDIYHAVLRHLKCSKYHWDPRLLDTQRNKESEATHVTQPTVKDDASNEIEDTQESPKEKKPNWLPLISFTPEPIDTEDLLEIAEREGLEEVIEEGSIQTSTASTTTQSKTPQNDQPRSEKPLLLLSMQRGLKQGLHTYKERKARYKIWKTKQRMQKTLKKSYEKKKLGLKELILARQKEFLTQSQKNIENTRSNNLMSNDLKSNADIY